MSDKMMRIAARKSNGTATPVSSDDKGRVITNRTWEKKWETIEESIELRDVSSYDLPAIDVRDVPLYSLRFLNRLGKPVTVTLKTDINTTNGYGLCDKNGQDIYITIQPSNSHTMITFNDFPELQWVQYLRMKVRAIEAPTSGTFSAYIVKVV